MLRTIARLIPGTFRGRLIIGVALVHGVMMTLFIADLTLRQNAMLLDRQYEEATALSLSLATSAAGWIAADDISGLQELVEVQRRYPEIIFAILTDDQGRVLAATDRSRLGQYVLDLPGDVRQTTLSRTPALVDIATPAILGGHHVGWARIGIGQKSASKKLSAITRNGIIYTLTAILLGSIFAWFMGNRITRRLYAVKETINAIRAGNHLARSTITGDDEAAFMAREFNSVLDSLDERERELHASEERYRSLIEKVQTAILLHDSQGDILTGNPMARKLLGLSEEELPGKSLTDPQWHFCREDGSVLPVAEYPASMVLSTGEPLRGYVMGIKQSGPGEVAWVLVNAEPEFDNSGRISLVIVSFVDITERKRTEAVLRESEETLKQAQRIAHLGTWHMDLATNQVVWSEVLYEIYGLEPALTPPLYTESMKLFTPESWERLSNAIARTTQTGIPYELELESVRDDGGRRWMWARGELVRDAHGTPVKVRGVVMDITERKRVEEELRRSEHGLAEAQRIAHLGNWTLDLVHNVLTWSDEIYRIFEIDPARFGASYEAFLNAIHPDDREMVNRAYTESVQNRVPYDIVHRLLMEDGRIKYVNERCETSYAEDGKPLRSVGTVHDITERKLVEEKIRRLNEELEQRVADRTAQLAAANKELEAFAYSVSHDLRAPLRHIDGYVDLLVSRYRDSLNEKGRHYVDTISSSARQMGVLIDDLLHFSRTGRAEMRMETIDMNQVLQEALVPLKESYAVRNVEWIIGDLPSVRGDTALLRQVWANLLGNAIKYTRQKEVARIEVSAREEKGEIVFSVSDNGVGFDMQYAGKLFGVFQRLHSQEEFEGTGIGLATVQRIIARHGGRVWADAKLGQGATFYFSLPVKEVSHA